ncbi:putative quorum-quenching lactonase YtnP [compost metagenome]
MPIGHRRITGGGCTFREVIVVNRSISTLAGRSRKLDGGALFGSTPRRAWSDWFCPDHDNQVELATRGLLVQQGRMNILILAGTDALLAPPPRSCRCQRPAFGLLDSLAQQGLDEGDIHAVLLTHLHAVLPRDVQDAVRDGDTPRLLFPAARYLTGRRHWLRARHPHPRDRALFIPQIIRQLEHSDRLLLLEEGGSELLGQDWRFHVSDGYTPGQLLPEIDMPGGPIVFAGDLVPATQWLRLDLTTAFDRNPESLVDEKERLLDHLVASGGRLLLARDPEVAMIKVLRDRQSRYQAFDQHAELHRLDS